jgi:hypothetical protein
MKTLSLLFAAPVLAFGLSGTALADERPDHFQGENAATLGEALGHLSSYNAQLAAILARDELGPEDTARIHELTYTLENALARIRDDVEDLQETLEEVHEASERYEVDVVRAQGRKYLDTAAELVP